jgi:hypothetical protein
VPFIPNSTNIWNENFNIANQNHGFYGHGNNKKQNLNARVYYNIRTSKPFDIPGL